MIRIGNATQAFQAAGLHVENTRELIVQLSVFSVPGDGGRRRIGARTELRHRQLAHTICRAMLVRSLADTCM